MNIDVTTSQAMFAIVPTILLPLTFISVGLTVLATFIAGLFGIELKAEGPKKLLEVLLRKRVLISALILNVVMLAGYKGYEYVKTRSALTWNIERANPGQEAYTAKYKAYPGHANSFQTQEKPVPAISELRTKWAVKLGGGPFRAAAISENSLFYGIDDFNAYEISQTDGSVIRKFFLGTKVSPSPLIWNNQLVLGEGTHHTHHARVYFFDLKSGKYLRSYETKGHTEGQPVLAKHNGKTLMFIVSGSDGIHAIDPVTTKVIWKQNDGHVDSSVFVSDGIVYVGTGRERGDSKKFRTYAVAYDFLTGEKVWKHELPASSWMKPTRAGNQVCFVMGEIYFESEFGSLGCFHAKTGAPSKNFRFLNPVVSRPIAIGDSIIIADLQGQVCSLNVAKGEREWCFDSGSKGKSLTGVNYDVARNLLLYPSVDAGLFVLDPTTGKKIFHWLPDDDKGKWTKTYAGVTVANGAWFVAHKSGVVRKLVPVLKTDGRVATEKPRKNGKG